MNGPYEVIKITELMRPGADGSADKYYRHTIRTKGGVVLTVDVRERDFTPEKVTPLLKEKAANADKILKAAE